MIGLVVAVMLGRGVDPVEVAATSFYAPLFVGALFYGPAAGAALGAAAAVGYLLLRLPAIDLVGFGALAGLLISRSLGFLVFGTLGGWAAGRLERAIGKLELHDPVDDLSGLGNARSALKALLAEKHRADRYGTEFSVVTVSVPAPAARTWRDLGAVIRARLRSSDTAARVDEDSRHLLVVVLPETDEEGARRVAGDLVEILADRWRMDVIWSSITYPGQEDRLSRLVADLEARLPVRSG